MRRARIVMVALLMMGMMAGAAAPASAQGYTGWIEHPYPEAGLWYCDYYGEEYWCQAPIPATGEWNWFRANPDWYDSTVASMASLGLSPS